MRNIIRTVIGLLMVAAGVLATAWLLYEVMRIGTCASGGAYVSARECPPGTGAKIGGLMGSIVLVIVGAVVTPGAAIAGVAWALGFILMGAAFFVVPFGPAAPPQGGAALKFVGVTVGGTFVLMGLPGLFALLGIRGRKHRKAQRLLATGKRCPGTVLSVTDTGVTINDNPRVAMRVRAEPPGEPTFEFEKKAVVSRVSIPRAGDRCAVFYDPTGEDDPGISFDGPALAMVGLGGGLGTIANDGVPTYAPPAAPSRTAPGTTVPSPDSITAELERLVALKATGALTEDEFEAAKAKILGTSHGA